MRILDLIKFTRFEEVDRAIRFFYPDDTNNYRKAFKIVKEIGSQEPRSKEYLVISMVFDTKYPDDCYYSMSTNKYSMSFSKWSELANLPIGKDTLAHYRPVEIVAHFIWEITFYGTEKESLDTGKGLFAAAGVIRDKLKSAS